MESICIRIRGPSGALSLRISANSTFGELRDRIEQDLNLTQEFDLLIGFPPVALTQDDEETISGVISNNENIRVQLKELSGIQAQGIAKKKRKAPAVSTAKEPPKFGFGANVHSIKKTDTVSNSFLVSSPQQRNGLASTAPKPKRQPRRSKTVTAGSEHDICEDLLAAVNGGTGSKNKMMRTVFRNAVAFEYNLMKAVSRLGAIYSNKYQIVEKATSRVLSSGVSTQIEVTFPKGAGNRGFYSETVDLLTKEGLNLLIRLPLIHANSAKSSSASAGDSEYVADAGDALEQGREVLKPANLSKASPRLFWSLVHHYGPNVHASLREILRELDPECAWLEERKKELSEKAKRNLEQKEAAERNKRSNKKAKTIAGAPTLAGASSVSESEVEVVDLVGSNTADSTAAATSEQCKLPSLWITHVNSHLTKDSVAPAEWLPPLASLMELDEKCDTFTFLRALANLTCEPSVRNKLVDLFLKTSSSSSSSSSNNQQPVGYSKILPLSQLDSWQTSALNVMVAHFWSEVVCAGACEVLRLALDRLRIRKPNEILIWRRGLGGLLQSLVKFNPALSELKLLNYADGTYSVLSEERLSQICDACEAFRAYFAHVDDLVFAENRGTPADQQEEVEEPDEGPAEEGWTKDHPWVGRRVRALHCDDENIDEGYWVEGTVVSYLPPDEEEPMALWKVRLDLLKAIDKRSELLDLEEEEVKEALDKWEKAHQ